MYSRRDAVLCFVPLCMTGRMYSKPAQLRKLEGPNYQHKFAVGRKSLSFRCRDFVAMWKKFWNNMRGRVFATFSTIEKAVAA